MNLEAVNSLLADLKSCQRHPRTEWTGQLRMGVDLGTSNVVVAVVDEAGCPVALAMEAAEVVRDGLVVDYVGAIDIVRRLVEQIKTELPANKLRVAATAIPPGTGKKSTEATRHVVEAAGLDVLAVVDEPSAAATVLGIKEGAVVDVGGGTTGISVVKEGRVVATADEPTGGIHFTLVIAGHYGVSFAEAERLKLSADKQVDLFTIVRPVMEKVTSIIGRHIGGWEVPVVYLVGGAVAFRGFAEVIQEGLGIPVIYPEEPLLVTPLGIALSCPVA